MQSRKIADVLKVSEGGLEDKKQKNRSSSLHKDDNQNQHVQIDSGFALQQFLDHIPIISIAGIKNSPVLELKAGDSIMDAIHMLYENDIFSAAIVDMSDIRFSDRYIGLIDFTSMVLWCLEVKPSLEYRTMAFSPSWIRFLRLGKPRLASRLSHSSMNHFSQ
ncbi:hypothetical protein GLYMA_04G011966v4 [Glycine max]|nr:hypothetical protein GLYMA_04G011966v4 [Glycine max]KAH1109243.1 hypothetical protein GYH30_008586 [Glycine max]